MTLKSLQQVGRSAGRIPGALMIIPLFLGALVNTFVPQVLDIGGFTTALFRDGIATLLGLFFVCMGAQLRLRATGRTLEKGFAILIGKVGAGVVVGLLVAFSVPGGTLFGLVPLAIIAAMTNSNTALYTALTKQFGNTTDRGAASIIAVNDGPFITLVALGVAGLATFPIGMIVGLVIPLAVGFVLGNLSSTAREFLRSGEQLLIPFMAFAVGVGIDFSTLGQAGLPGILLGLMTIVLSGGAAMLVLWFVHVLHRRPRQQRNVISGAAEATTAGNAVATPAAVAIIDPAYRHIESLATAQVATSTITTALLVPFVVAFAYRIQLNRGISPQAEEEQGGERVAT
ncbi:2-keto-3-deoxygluconate permease [Pseudonocardia sp. MH-G8]|uniref:2-keto-3-deoxygluconate permease n=1 Tax=Pseudonocardia sp. MH-G8 TaxID=1854588 RepID=UPI000B9FB43A|nr:2-keto-3-deoxygluconate permease [Pseudonocardia sp. MH-G8]OZM76921.1 2-keto-3-deoxygluconate permease [Pseudonocardia sp. MH-G8]